MNRTCEVEVAITRKKHRREAVACEPALPRISLVARLLALAIKFQDLIDNGEVRDFADLARLGFVSRARLTQIMNLLLLAPDIQEDVLLCGAPATERLLRRASYSPAWSDQRKTLNLAVISDRKAST